MKVLLIFALVATLCHSSQAELQKRADDEEFMCYYDTPFYDVICELSCRQDGTGSGKCVDGACICGEEAATSSVITKVTCTNSLCQCVCNQLGWRNGYCGDPKTCVCTNFSTVDDISNN